MVSACQAYNRGAIEVLLGWLLHGHVQGICETERIAASRLKSWGPGRWSSAERSGDYHVETDMPWIEVFIPKFLGHIQQSHMAWMAGFSRRFDLSARNLIPQSVINRSW